MNVSILGVSVHALGMEEALERIEKALEGEKPFQVVTANPLMLLAAEKDDALKGALVEAGLVLPDGVGLVLAAKRQDRPLQRVPGIELMEKLCERAARRGRRVFLLGAAPGVADRTGEKLKERFPGLSVVGTRDGYFLPSEEVALLEKIAAARPDFLFVALSSPKQDAWIHQNLSRLGAKVVMGVGGSFDVLSGRLRRAPTWMQALGLEWFYRLLQEPRRLGRMLHLPVFLWKILAHRGRA